MSLADDALHELAALSGVVLKHESIEEALDDICRIAARAVPGRSVRP